MNDRVVNLFCEVDAFISEGFILFSLKLTKLNLNQRNKIMMND